MAKIVLRYALSRGILKYLNVVIDVGKEKLNQRVELGELVVEGGYFDLDPDNSFFFRLAAAP